MISILEGTLKRKTTLEGQEISFLTKDIQEADDFFAKNINKPILVDFKSPSEAKKRSLNSNSYMWSLCERIAQTIRSTRVEVYRDAIRNTGVYHDGAFQVKDLKAIKEAWESNGIGWFCEDFDSRLDGCRRVRFYHGSSLYSTTEMSRLIDYVVDEAKGLGIETLTPDKLEQMKQQWGVE